MLDIPFSVRASGTLVVACLVLYPARAHVSGVHQAPAEAAQAAYARIRDEGLSRSRVMDYPTELIDAVGPRLTGSRSRKKAIDWSGARRRSGCLPSPGRPSPGTTGPP